MPSSPWEKDSSDTPSDPTQWGQTPSDQPPASSPPTQPYNQPYNQQYGQQPGQQPYQPYGGPPPGVGYGYGAARPTNGMAIASLVVSIAGLLMCCGAPSIIGAILGHVAKGQIKRNGEQGDGLALAGIIVGWIAFAIFVLVAILYAGIFIAALSADSDYSSDF